MSIEEREWLEEGLLQDDAAAFLKVSPDWLERKRCTGGGPRYRRLSAKQIVYVRRDLLEFRDRMAFESTSEYQRDSASSPAALEDGAGGEGGS